MVRTIDAIRLCRDGGYGELPRNQAEAYLTQAARHDRTFVCDFIQRAGLTSLSLSTLDDLRLFELLRQLVKSADLVVVREGEEATDGDVRSLAEQRRLARAIDTKMLNHEGRKYRLVADVDLRQVPNRDSYEVVSQNDAMRVLEALSKQATPSLASLLGEARDRLTRDWRPPLSPDGLVLLRRAAQLVAPIAHSETALTPSQLQKLRPDVTVAPSAEHEQAAELAASAEMEEPFELETGAEAETTQANTADNTEVAA